MNLKKLQLTNVHVDEALLRDIAGNCPYLEWLSLCSCVVDSIGLLHVIREMGWLKVICFVGDYLFIDYG